MIKQFITDVCWGSLDYLIIDTPPGKQTMYLVTLHNLHSLSIVFLIYNCQILFRSTPN